LHKALINFAGEVGKEGKIRRDLSHMPLSKNAYSIGVINDMVTQSRTYLG
jgi:hypothetical protein